MSRDSSDIIVKCRFAAQDFFKTAAQYFYGTLIIFKDSLNRKKKHLKYKHCLQSLLINLISLSNMTFLFKCSSFNDLVNLRLNFNSLKLYTLIFVFAMSL